jgi:hypothetical protein
MRKFIDLGAVILQFFLQRLSQIRLQKPSSLFHLGFKWITTWPISDAIVQARETESIYQPLNDPKSKDPKI